MATGGFGGKKKMASHLYCTVQNTYRPQMSKLQKTVDYERLHSFLLSSKCRMQENFLCVKSEIFISSSEPKADHMSVKWDSHLVTGLVWLGPLRPAGGSVSA
jgi:hypothetical protein